MLPFHWNWSQHKNNFCTSVNILKWHKEEILLPAKITPASKSWSLGKKKRKQWNKSKLWLFPPENWNSLNRSNAPWSKGNSRLTNPTAKPPCIFPSQTSNFFFCGYLHPYLDHKLQEGRSYGYLFYYYLPSTLLETRHIGNSQ